MFTPSIFTNGHKQWAAKTGGAVEASPLILDGRVFVGSFDNQLYALDAATGNVIWKYETGDKILGHPTGSSPATRTDLGRAVMISSCIA